MRRRRKASKKVRARRLYKRLYKQLRAQTRLVVTLSKGSDMRAHLAAAMRHTRLVFRLCRIEYVSGEPWDTDRMFLPRRSKRKTSKKVRAQRLYRRLYDRLFRQYRAAITALHAGDLPAHDHQWTLFSRTIARTLIVERASGVPWDVDKYIAPDP